MENNILSPIFSKNYKIRMKDLFRVKYTFTCTDYNHFRVLMVLHLRIYMYYFNFGVYDMTKDYLFKNLKEFKSCFQKFLLRRKNTNFTFTSCFST